MKFNYLKINDISQLEKVLREIAKLNRAKLNYSIQELQSMDILDESKIIENKRILEETNEFLNSATNISSIEEKYKNSKDESRSGYEKSIIKKNVAENIDIDVSTFKERVFTIADVSFKANKYTKWLCENVIYNIANNNLKFKEVLWKLKGIYNKANREDVKKINIKAELERLAEELNRDENKGWKENLKIDVKDKKDTQKLLRVLYRDLSPIWDTESTLYEIKNQLNKQLVRSLVTDNYKTFSNWGFSKDEKGKWVLNFDPKEVYERYAFHVPDLRKILNKDIIKKVIYDRRFEYMREFTNSIRKNTLDRIKEDDTVPEILAGKREKLITILRRENVDLEQYTIAKFVSQKEFEYIEKKYPELKEKCEMLKELIEPQNDRLISDEETIEQAKNITGYEELIRTQIEENLINYKKIFVQYGENLDKNASIYALKKHMKEKFNIDDIEVIEINAGERKIPYEKQGLVIDAGKLLGNNLSIDTMGEINANVKKAQKSACGVLNQYGIYVPPKIVQYADGIIDERSLDARYGVNLSRKLKDEKLFEFAEEKRKDGTYLMESSLTDDELEKYNLTEECHKRDAQIKRGIVDVSENIYTFESDGIEKHICMVDHYINCGAMLSYSLGCDYYLSISDKQADFIDNPKNLYEENKSIPKATFSITADPNKGNGKLPISILEYCNELARNGENEVLKIITIASQDEEIENKQPYIKPTNDMVVFGGPKTPNLFVTLKHPDQEENISETIMYEICDILGIKTIKQDKKKKMIENSAKDWKNIKAKELVEELLKQMGDKKISLSDVQREGKDLLELSAERGEEIDNREN